MSVVSRVKMQHSVDQRYALKFCVKLEKSVTKTLATIQKAYGKDALSKAQVFRWHKALSGTLPSLLDQIRLEGANQR